MKLIKLRIQNFRSIVDSQDVRIESFQAFVGENNAGKSNILYAIRAFLTSGAGGIQDSDFFDTNKPIIITATFGNLTLVERKCLRPYLMGDRLILEKHINLELDRKTEKIKPIAEYHGYVAKPKDWWLSTEGVINHEAFTKPDWKKIANSHGIVEYVQDESGKVNKATYEAGIRKLLIEKEDIEFEAPKLGETQALGLQPVLIDSLPEFYMLPAITDYSDEIGRSSTTSFNKLMGDLANRILKLDPKYKQVEATLNSLRELLNAPKEGEKREDGNERLVALEGVESKLKEIIAKLMPSVLGIRIKVTIDQVKDVFSKGISILVDDGKLTEVLMKGHGLQRCVVFGLIQALILNQRGMLVPITGDQAGKNREDEEIIILVIEEPELYIHPQMQRLVYGVLKDFANTDQIIYTTHSPAFVDVASYDSIAVVRKESIAKGSYICQCEAGILEQGSERKTFQFLSSFGLEQNQMFFAKKLVLVEGEEDIIAILTTGRQLSLFKEFPEEIGYTLISTDSRDELPKYMKLLNAFCLPYIVLHELDGDPKSQKNEEIRILSKGNKTVEIPNRLEDLVKHAGHFHKIYDAKKFFEDPHRITEEFKAKVKEIFES